MLPLLLCGPRSEFKQSLDELLFHEVDFQLKLLGDDIVGMAFRPHNLVRTDTAKRAGIVTTMILSIVPNQGVDQLHRSLTSFPVEAIARWQPSQLTIVYTTETILDHSSLECRSEVCWHVSKGTGRVLASGMG